MNAADIDTLAAAIRSQETDVRFDVNADDVVDSQDHDFLIDSVFKTQAGDADLDRDVDFADFLLLSASFDKPNTGWTNGNFDLDLSVTLADFLLLAGAFGDDFVG